MVANQPGGHKNRITFWNILEVCNSCIWWCRKVIRTLNAQYFIWST